MNLLVSFLLLQAITTGVVAGTVKRSDGTPAAGVRVYTIDLRDATDGPQDVTVLEVLAETDAEGNYRLEVKPGRYYIAAGSVDTPTYYPDTTSIISAKPVTIEAGSRIENMNFSSFAPRSGGFLAFAASLGSILATPAPTFALSGVVRLADGSPANNLEVIAVPARLGPSPQPVVRTRTDHSGTFRLDVVADSYYIVSGPPDAPTIYPGTPDIESAGVITVRSQSIDKRDFDVPGVRVSGRVLAAGNEPAPGAIIQIHRKPSGNSVPPSASRVSRFLSQGADWDSSVQASDGTFSVSALPDGNYVAEVSAESSPVETREFVVAGRAVRDLDFKLQIASLSGKVIFEDGTPAAGVQDLGGIVVSTLDSAEESSSTILSISDAGTFTGLLDPGEYNLTLPSLPAHYNVTAIVAGDRDLLANSFNITSSQPVQVEIRVERLAGK